MQQPRKDNRSLSDKIYKDKHGNITLWQKPNLPIISWAVATIGAKLAKQGAPNSFFETIAFGAIFTWAYLEIFHGSNYFRRVLGLAVIFLSIAPKIR